MNFVSLGVALAALAFAPSLAAQPEPHGDGSMSVGATSVPEPEPARLPRVHVTAVGMPAVALERALGPGLESSYTLVFSSAERFGPEQLFSARIESPPSIHVWVDTTTPGNAQLYFVNRDGTRYLVRTLEISPSFDEMDSESLAQAIEWSLQALVEGSAGLTRAEAESLFHESANPSAKVRPSPERAAEPRPSSDWRRKTIGWLPEVALLHGWTMHSAELPGVQGPVVRVGLDQLVPGRQVGFAMSAQYQYPQRYAELGVALEVQSVASRVEARYLATDLVDGSAFGVRLGLGLDVVFSSTEALDYERFEATENGVDSVPLAASGLIWQLRVERNLRLELSVGAELDFVDVHYDVVTNDGTVELVSRWPVRPSASIGLELF